jgi:hypothetical protein
MITNMTVDEVRERIPTILWLREKGPEFRALEEAEIVTLMQDVLSTIAAGATNAQELAEAVLEGISEKAAFVTI